MKRNKWVSRKFLVAVGMIAVTLVVGLGYQLDPKLVAMLTLAESALWIVVEGAIDMVKGGAGSHGRWLSRKFILAVAEVVVLIVLGFGYELDKEFLASLIGAEGALWVIMEGIIDMVKKGQTS
ncbi:MAG: hypothetical protein CMI54_02895 [Parcubacteria group bacterium]|nr:hypothetical protein [Parcubacteria group bacterium]|tara:strand:- start:11490 stop:11858 length:369 start_codon:yes stop_codon:yes gene_type:complete